MTWIMIDEEEMLNSHDVVPLFINTSINKALEVICSSLEMTVVLNTEQSYLSRTLWSFSNLC